MDFCACRPALCIDYSFAVAVKVNTKLHIHKNFPSAHAYLNHLWNSCTMLILGTWCASIHGLAKHFTYVILWLPTMYTCTHACVYTATMES